jgi:adenylate cyclase
MAGMKSFWTRIASGIAVGTVCTVLIGIPQIRDLEQEVGLRWLFNLRGPVKPPDQVVMVLMNQEAASNISLPRDPEKFYRCVDLMVGPAPRTHVSLPTMPSRWPRCLHAQLVNKLVASGVSVIAFDVLFRQRPPLPGPSGDLDAWQDDAFASALSSAARVVVAQKLEINDGRETLSELSPAIANAALGSAPFPLVADPGRRVDSFMAFMESGHGSPTLPAIALQAYTLGAYPSFVELLTRHSGDAANLLPTTADALRATGQLQATGLVIRQLLRRDAALAHRVLEELDRSRSHVTPQASGNQLRSLVSMFSGDNTRLLNFYGPAGTIPALSYDQVLASSSESMAGSLRGRVVFVGYGETAQPEQVEHFATAFSSGDAPDLSGVEIAATAFSNLLQDNTIRQLSFTSQLVLIFLAAFLSTLVCEHLTNRLALGIMAVALGLYAGASLYAFAFHALWIPIVLPMLVAAPAGVLSAFVLKYWAARTQREQLRHAFSYFVPSEVVSMLEHNAGQIGSQKDSLECACVATDAANFTPLAESMTSEQLSEFLNRYFESLFGRVADHGGFVSDIIGDAMLAIWPHRSADTRVRLLHALLEMRDAAQQFNERLAGNRLMTRFGVDWGRVTLTTIGAHAHYEYRAVGEAVNTASRIQELNKKLGTRVLLSRPCIGDAGSAFLTRDVGCFLLRGKSHVVHLFELLDSTANARREQSDLCERFTAGLEAFKLGQNQQALSQFREVQASFPSDGPTAFYLRALESGLSLHDGALRAD